MAKPSRRSVPVPVEDDPPAIPSRSPGPALRRLNTEARDKLFAPLGVGSGAKKSDEKYASRSGSRSPPPTSPGRRVTFSPESGKKHRRSGSGGALVVHSGGASDAKTKTIGVLGSNVSLEDVPRSIRQPDRTVLRRAAAAPRAVVGQHQDPHTQSKHLLVARHLLHHYPKSSAAGNEEVTLGNQIVATKLTDGGVFLKYGRNGRPHHRLVWVAPDLTRVYWGALVSNRHERKPRGELVVADVQFVVAGHQTVVFERYRKKGADDSACFSLVAGDRTLDLEAVSTQERDLWVLAFTALIKREDDVASGVAAASRAKNRAAAKGEEVAPGDARSSEEARKQRESKARAKAQLASASADTAGGPAGGSADDREHEMTTLLLREEVAMLRKRLEASLSLAEVNKVKQLVRAQTLDEAKRLEQKLHEENSHLHEVEHRAALLEAENRQLLDDKAELLGLQRSEKGRFLTKSLKTMGRRAFYAEHQLEQTRELNEQLQLREARRQQMLWEVNLDPPGSVYTPSTEPWSDEQKRRLRHERHVLKHFFPDHVFLGPTTQAAQLVLPIDVAASGRHYEVTIVLEGFPLRTPPAILTQPQHPVDGVGNLLTDLSPSTELALLDPFNGYPRLDFDSQSERRKKKKKKKRIKLARQEEAQIQTGLSPSLLHICRVCVAWVEDHDRELQESADALQRERMAESVSLFKKK